MKEAILKLQTYKLFEDGEVLVCRDDVLKALEQEPCENTKTGHWINGKCTKCGNHAPFHSMSSCYYPSEFCPNCGAKMKEEVEE